jgi:hypothetical protein
MRKLMMLWLGLFLTGAGILGATDEFSQIVVDGKPPITFSGVMAHIRLIEFVLNTRLTTAQKNTFRDTIVREITDMNEQDRKDFLQAEQLLGSMRSMKEFELKAVYDVLRADYEDSAGTDPEDHSGRLFLEVMKNHQDHLAEGNNAVFSRQALLAFFEYLEMLASAAPSLREIPAQQATDVENAFQKNFPLLSETDQETLNAFDRRWHVIKAAWAGADAGRRQNWLPTLTAPFIATPALDLNAKEFLEKVAGTATWKEMASFAATLGETETGYYATPSLVVW